tara:strand:+ start:2972 stop:3877 length:906 start_codon:yes stop_codon:yes gene_type:complete
MYYIQGFYKIKKIKKTKYNKELIKSFFISNSVKGTLIISAEGINGTIAGKKNNLKKCVKYIKDKFKINSFDNQNLSKCNFQPFYRTKVKLKKEVVPIGFKLSIKQKLKSMYVNPKSWNKLISKKNVMLIDVRKPFEYKVGTFKGAINPQVDSFRKFPKYFNKLKKNKSIAMFCTGGVRCEKASTYLRNKGFRKIYQLNGGVLNYLKEIEKPKSLWRGECFVFDNRISVKHKLKLGSYSMCRGCRMPISLIEKKSKKFKEGISCPHCYNKLTQNQKERFSMRQKQIVAAKKLNKSHIFQKEY